eukprot:CAMPEP_0201630302 /NCGR_PEP_ID=MMETSP0493-20130528/4673_1 /ASSEMBLY_ACC=CAM_ASM_000838 /TAXON_ID=420259 /ORGANISM="Thalassiosira gravida, Strain GMp14c1" /LENGTH=337 /DNA_ID=CAMNT_0048101439 /DNA_START=36 /DNA_END=1049 /DNA_ORIENTATION=+
MALSDAEKKRRSRAKKPVKYHDLERETSRKRMAIYRAKNKVQKRASQLKMLLSDEDKKEVEEHVAKQRQNLICDWFKCHNLRVDPKMISDAKILNSFMTKAEIHKMELRLAEFEISIIEDKDEDDEDESVDDSFEFINALGLGVQGGGIPKRVNNIEPTHTQVFVGAHQELTNDELDNLIKMEIAPLVTDAEDMSSETNSQNEPDISGMCQAHATNPRDPIIFGMDHDQSMNPSTPYISGPNENDITQQVALTSLGMEEDQSLKPAAPGILGTHEFQSTNPSAHDPNLLDLQLYPSSLDVLEAENDVLLRMDMEGFDIDVNGLAANAEGFVADAFQW